MRLTVSERHEAHHLEAGSDLDIGRPLSNPVTTHDGLKELIDDASLTHLFARHRRILVGRQDASAGVGDCYGFHGISTRGQWLRVCVCGDELTVVLNELSNFRSLVLGCIVDPGAGQNLAGTVQVLQPVLVMRECGNRLVALDAEELSNREVICGAVFPNHEGNNPDVVRARAGHESGFGDTEPLVPVGSTVPFVSGGEPSSGEEELQRLVISSLGKLERGIHRRTRGDLAQQFRDRVAHSNPGLGRWGEVGGVKFKTSFDAAGRNEFHRRSGFAVPSEGVMRRLMLCTDKVWWANDGLY